MVKQTVFQTTPSGAAPAAPTAAYATMLHGVGTAVNLAVQIRPASPLRQEFVIRNTHAALTLYLGHDATLTNVNAPIELRFGESYSFGAYTGEIWAFGEVAGTTYRYMEGLL